MTLYHSLIFEGEILYKFESIVSDGVWSRRSKRTREMLHVMEGLYVVRCSAGQLRNERVSE